MAVPAWTTRLSYGLVGIGPEELGWLPPSAVQGKTAAVLALLVDVGDRPAVVLTRRAPSMPSHAGQIAFPGGTALASDENLRTTAIREAGEEIGLGAEHVAVLFVAPATYLPRSAFLITTVFAWSRLPAESFRPHSAEVAALHVVPLEGLADPANRVQIRHHSGRLDIAFRYDDLFVWGFTARVIGCLIRVAGLERAWDRSRVEPDPYRP